MKRLFINIALAFSAIAPFTLSSAQALQNAEQPADAWKVMALYPGVAPGSETWTWKETLTSMGGGRRIRNVVQPTLTVFKPVNPARANGTTVIVAPGGAFYILAIDKEGYDVARSLAAEGYTAIVLKYRLNHMPDTDEEFLRSRDPASRSAPAPTAATLALDRKPETNPGVADGIAAVRYVRTHASELGIDPNRIGMVGFSAGGYVVHGAVVYGDEASRPNFAAQIYAGAEDDVKWPVNTPPMFLAVGNEDFLFTSVLSAFKTLTAAKHSVELHVYNKTAHGFGMSKLGQTSDLWFDEFLAWMSSLGYMTKR